MRSHGVWQGRRCDVMWFAALPLEAGNLARRVTLRSMSPRHPGWRALAEAVAPGARVTRLRRLAGAGMTDAYDVTLDRTPAPSGREALP